ncbi:hypothetical protein [Olleya namhaensis]|uniref:hypothetical protein n=1 Tax=Olleya namhaensis TaxID=1144750 RepID=UPI0023313402|nr:hypothetical protein [Olleya namhaensis]
MSESRIKALKEQISNTQRNIKITRKNTAKHKANGSPAHYQESGKRTIKSAQNQIKKYKEEITELKDRKPSRKRKSVFKGNILFLPFRLFWRFFMLILKD